MRRKSEPRRGGGIGAQSWRLADGGSYPAALITRTAIDATKFQYQSLTAGLATDELFDNAVAWPRDALSIFPLHYCDCG